MYAGLRTVLVLLQCSTLGVDQMVPAQHAERTTCHAASCLQGFVGPFADFPLERKTNWAVFRGTAHTSQPGGPLSEWLQPA